MDLEARGAKELGREFLRRYLELADDRELPELLPFYQCYRALVRGKVYSLLSPDKADRAGRYFDLAYSATWGDLKPFVVMICGLSGSGKSSLARALARRLGAAVINSDVVRKGLAGTSHRRSQDSYGGGIYAAPMTDRTYRKMTEEAERHLAAGEGVILDATFQKTAQRSAVFEMAARNGAPVAIVYCHTREELIRERLRRRAAEGRDVSDGDWQIYLKQKELFEPLTETALPRLALDTEPPVAELCQDAERFLRARFSKDGKETGSQSPKPALSQLAANR
jgi:predicted kinase